MIVQNNDKHFDFQLITAFIDHKKKRILIALFYIQQTVNRS